MYEEFFHCRNTAYIARPDTRKAVYVYENFYQGFVVGALSHMDGYIVKSNRETAGGRSDIYNNGIKW
ncbi:hypothetical protein EI970_19630 [Clostridium butyricum]|nr:hypothetical protein EI970_19630 [Clostridium butyricum]